MTAIHYKDTRVMWRSLRLNDFLSVGLLSFLVVIGTGSIARAQEDEPNDSLASATTMELTGVGTLTIADMALGNGDWPDRDVDIYLFKLDEAILLPILVTVQVESTDSSLDTFLRLFDESGNELINNDDRSVSDSDPHLQTYLLTHGIYYVGVSTAGNPHYDNTVGGSGRPGVGGTYSVTVSMDGVALPSSQFEPNDCVGNSTFAGSSSFSVTGECIGDGTHSRSDVDVFMLRLTGPALLEVAALTVPYNSLLDPVLRLRTCRDGIDKRTHVDPCLLAASSETHGGTGRVDVSAGVLEAQDVYIMVSGSGNRRYDPSCPGSGEIGSVGCYDLVATVTYHTDYAAADEPNDSITMATHLPPFVAGRPEVIEVDAFIGDGIYAPFQGDRDFYELTVIDEMRLVTVDVEAITSELDPIVAVYDSLGAPVTFNDNRHNLVDARLVLPQPCVHVSSPEPSAYIMVMGTKQRWPDDPETPYGDEIILDSYALEDGPGSTGPYHLTITAEAVEPCVGDPGDTLATAASTGIVDEGVYACTHALMGDSACDNPLRDTDLWSVEVTHPPARLHITVSACYDDPYALDIGVIRVFGPSGEELASTDLNVSYQASNNLEVKLSDPGAYYIGISENDNSYDPHIPCSGMRYADSNYDIGIVVTPAGMQQTPPQTRTAGARTESFEENTSHLFVKRLDAAESVIDVLDSDTGLLSASFSTPESRLSILGGIAYNGSYLYYLGAGRYPRLYQLEPATGTVIDEFILWLGSGYYNDAVMLAGKLYLLDLYDQTVHVFDPVVQRYVRTLPIGWEHGITISGGLASLTGPDRLYVTDPFNTRNIYEIDPASGTLTRTLPSPTDRPTVLAGIGTSTLYVGDWESSSLDVIDQDGSAVGSLELFGPPSSLAGSASIDFFPDFDGDSDIDLIDFGSFQRCFTGSTGALGPDCEPGDRNGDDHVDLSDFAAFPAASTGP